MNKQHNRRTYLVHHVGPGVRRVRVHRLHQAHPAYRAHRDYRWDPEVPADLADRFHLVVLVYLGCQARLSGRWVPIITIKYNKCEVKQL